MSTAIRVPSVGESITEGTIARWFKKDGEQVRADEPVLELETEKASTEVPAPAAGILHIKEREGATVTIGAVVGEIEAVEAAPTKAEEVKAGRGEKGRKGEEERARGHVAASAAPAPLLAAPQSAPVPHSLDGASAKRQTISEARESTARDDAGSKRQTGHERESRQRMSAIRQRIAARLVTSQQTTASLTTFNEVDLSAVIDARTQSKERFKAAHGVGLGFMSFFVKACVAALKGYPILNSRIDGEDLVTCNYWNIGVAVSTEKGLVVPVLHDADRLSFADIEKRIADLAARARDGKIHVEDLQGGTFTITNGGVFGSMLSTPILNPPQSAILGMHAIEERPVVRDGQVVIRPMMYLALTYDHRLIDGREAVLFLVRIKENIENPLRLLLAY